MRRFPRRSRREAGFTLVELAISMAILATIMVFMTVHMQQEARGLRQLQAISNQERLVQDLLTKIEIQLDFAQGVVPTAALASSLPAGETFVVDVDATDGFPDVGRLLIDAGTAAEERIDYTDMDPAAGAFMQLSRGPPAAPRVRTAAVPRSSGPPQQRCWMSRSRRPPTRSTGRAASCWVTSSTAETGRASAIGSPWIPRAAPTI